MKAALAKPKLGSRGRPEQSRTAILRAAVQEISREGLAGARIDAIARSARVNKALLYYYFQDKDALYGAVLDHVFGGLTATVLDVLSRPLPPRERLLVYVQTHFDYIAKHPLYPRIVQEEMMRAGQGGSGQLERVVRAIFPSALRQAGGAAERRQGRGRIPRSRSAALCSIHDFDHHFLFQQRAGHADDARRRSVFAGAPAGAAGRDPRLYFGSLVFAGHAVARRKQVSTRNKFAILIGIILAASLAYYLLSTPRDAGLVLIGTVDANEVIVSPQIQGRLSQLLVDEGSHVNKGI